MRTRSNGNTKPPPQVMTWGQAMPTVVVATGFYLLRFVFEQFWFFGPAIGAAMCTSWASGAVGTKIAGMTCTALAGVAGFFGFAAIEAFGMIMAMAVAFLGWLTVGAMILMRHPRVLTARAGSSLWFMGGLGISIIPIIGSLPGILGAVLKLYSGQIKQDRALLRAYEKEIHEKMLNAA